MHRAADSACLRCLFICRKYALSEKKVPNVFIKIVYNSISIYTLSHSALRGGAAWENENRSGEKKIIHEAKWRNKRLERYQSPF